MVTIGWRSYPAWLRSTRGSKRSPLEIKSYTQVAFVMPRFPISLKYRKCFGLPMGSSV